MDMRKWSQLQNFMGKYQTFCPMSNCSSRRQGEREWGKENIWRNSGLNFLKFGEDINLYKILWYSIRSLDFKENAKKTSGNHAAAATAKLLQSCPTLCNPIDGSPPGSSIPGILQARILEWVAISFSNAWKWKVKVKVKSCPTLSDPMDPTRLLCPWEPPGKRTGVGCHLT